MQCDSGMIHVQWSLTLRPKAKFQFVTAIVEAGTHFMDKNMLGLVIHPDQYQP